MTSSDVLTVERNSDEQYDKLIVDGNTQGHANEDAMEQNSSFQHDAVHNVPLSLFVSLLLLLGDLPLFILAVDL